MDEHYKGILAKLVFGSYDNVEAVLGEWWREQPWMTAKHWAEELGLGSEQDFLDAIDAISSQVTGEGPERAPVVETMTLYAPDSEWMALLRYLSAKYNTDLREYLEGPSDELPHPDWL